MTTMAAVVVDDDGESDLSLDELIQGFTEMSGKHKKNYDIAEEYYEGTRPEFFASIKYKRALQRTGTTFRLNYAKTPVDALVDRLEINGIVTGDNYALAVLEAFWEENQMDLESMELHKRACEFGDAYVLVWPNDDADQEKPDDIDSAMDDSSDDSAVGIEAYYNDPRTLRLFYDPENPRRKKYGMKMWELKNRRNEVQVRANLYFKDRIEKYITKVNGKGDEESSWIKYQDKDDPTWPLDNPYGQVPIFHFRTERPYGLPVHKDAYGPQDIITKLVITHMNTVDYHGFPQRWAISGDDLGNGDEESEDFAFDDDLSGDDSDQGIVVGGRSQLRSDPGHVWFLKNIKQVGQFDAAKSDVFLLPLIAYVRAMAQVCRTPVHKFDYQGNPPSGESLRVAEQPFVKKVKNVQMSFEATWNDLLEFVLKIMKIDGKHFKVPPVPKVPIVVPNIVVSGSGSTAVTAYELPTQPDPNQPQGQVIGPPGKVTVTWSSPAVNDDQLSWDIAIMKRDAGVPIRQVLLETNYTKKQLDAWGVPPSTYTAPPQAVAVKGPTNLPQPRVNPVMPVGRVP
jgi:hypothetical protein